MRVDVNYFYRVLENWKKDFLQPRSLKKAFLLRLTEVIVLTTILTIVYFYSTLSSQQMTIVVFSGGIFAIFVSYLIYRTFLKKLPNLPKIIRNPIRVSFIIAFCGGWLGYLGRLRWGLILPLGMIIISIGWLLLKWNYQARNSSLLTNSINQVPYKTNEANIQQVKDDNIQQEEEIAKKEVLSKIDPAINFFQLRNNKGIYANKSIVWIKNEKGIPIRVNLEKLSKFYHILNTEAKTNGVQIKLKRNEEYKELKLSDVEYTELSVKLSSLLQEYEAAKRNEGELDKIAKSEVSNLENGNIFSTSDATINEFSPDVKTLSFHFKKESLSWLEVNKTNSFRTIIISDVKLTTEK